MAFQQERLRIVQQLQDDNKRLRKENESLRMMGSPVVEATIQHQAMEIMKLKQQVAELREFAEEVRRNGDTRLASMAISQLARTAPKEE